VHVARRHEGGDGREGVVDDHLLVVRGHEHGHVLDGE
jgi:hypothetical protein